MNEQIPNALLELPEDTNGSLGYIYRGFEMKEQYSFYPDKPEESPYETPWFTKGNFPEYRFNCIARSYYWDEYHAWPRAVEHTKGEWSLVIMNPIEGVSHEMVMPASADPYHVTGFIRSRSEYPLIQEAFPTLDAERRDFILLGVSPEWWNRNFPQETEESTGDDSVCAVYEEDIRGNPLRGSAPSSVEGRTPKG